MFVAHKAEHQLCGRHQVTVAMLVAVWCMSSMVAKLVAVWQTSATVAMLVVERPFLAKSPLQLCSTLLL